MECQVLDGKNWTTCVLKDCWMNEGYISDMDIHHLLQSRVARPFFNPGDEEIFGSADSFNIFSDCVQVEGHWDSQPHLRGIPLVRASMVPDCDTPTLDADGKVVMKKLPDTTSNILRRFTPSSDTIDSSQPKPPSHNRSCATDVTEDSANTVPAVEAVPEPFAKPEFASGLSFEPRSHIRVLYTTIATSIAWFSCRREFLNAVMCAIIGESSINATANIS